MSQNQLLQKPQRVSIEWNLELVYLDFPAKLPMTGANGAIHRENIIDMQYFIY